MATMILYNQNTGKIYGYFGTPYPTNDTAIQMCFPNADIHQDETVTDDDENVIYLKDLRTTVVNVNDVLYLTFDTGEVWEKTEIRTECNEMTDEEFEEYLNSLIRQGLEKTGGIIEMEK